MTICDLTWPHKIESGDIKCQEQKISSQHLHIDLIHALIKPSTSALISLYCVSRGLCDKYSKNRERNSYGNLLSVFLCACVIIWKGEQLGAWPFALTDQVISPIFKKRAKQACIHIDNLYKLTWKNE